MNDSLSAAILGVVQGVTEFLPVSSSGHLVLFQQWLPTTGDPIAFDLALHIGTLLPVMVVYREDIVRVFRDAAGGDGPFWVRPGVRLALWIVVGSLPTAAIGLAFEDVFEHLFSNPASVSVTFAITGVFLFATRFAPKGAADERTMTWWQAVLIGVAQGIAIAPGISRSGSTIVAALFLGMDRAYAARFSFLLSIPAISGAFLLKARGLEMTGSAAFPMAIGFFAAAASGYLALRVLIRLVRSGDFSRFCWYMWPLALFSGWVALG
jgi:undecaprenyl-diphosphatase